jgi:hypothetical protein
MFCFSLLYCCTVELSVGFLAGGGMLLKALAGRADPSLIRGEWAVGSEYVTARQYVKVSVCLSRVGTVVGLLTALWFHGAVCERSGLYAVSRRVEKTAIVGVATVATWGIAHS